MTKEKETKCDDLIDALLEEHGISQEHPSWDSH